MQKKILQSRASAIAEKMLGRTLPCSIEAERSVLGSLLLYDGQFQLISEFLISNDFYLPSNKIIYEAMMELYRKGEPIDTLSVSSKLKEKKMWIPRRVP